MPSCSFLAVLALLTTHQAPASDPAISDVRALTTAVDNDQRFDAVTAMLRARNLPFTVEPFTLEKPLGSEPRTRGRNVVLSLGDGPRHIVLGAHYDAVRLADKSLSPGAVDNAAASVMLVRLADAVREARLPIRVTFVWFDMEELGLIGSARYVEAHAADPVTAMLNFDIDGYGDTVLFGPPAGGDDAELAKAFRYTCADAELDCIRFARMPPGDDRSFGKAHVPTLSIALLPAIEIHQLWLILHGGAGSGLAAGTQPAIMHTIHTPEDVLAKVDPAAIQLAERVSLALLRRLSATRP
jgi:hypothetical protein